MPAGMDQLKGEILEGAASQIWVNSFFPPHSPQSEPFFMATRAWMGKKEARSISLSHVLFLLVQWSSTCGPWTSSINITWELGKSANPEALAQTYQIRNSQGTTQQSMFPQALLRDGVILITIMSDNGYPDTCNGNLVYVCICTFWICKCKVIKSTRYIWVRIRNSAQHETWQLLGPS